MVREGLSSLVREDYVRTEWARLPIAEGAQWGVSAGSVIEVYIHIV